MEPRVPRTEDPAQIALLTRFCQEAEGLLKGATDYASALRLRDEVCGRFQKECHSGLIVNATREYLMQIITHTWQQDHDQDN